MYQYASNTLFANWHDVVSEPRPELVAHPERPGRWYPSGQLSPKESGDCTKGGGTDTKGVSAELVVEVEYEPDG